ncbi:MAG: flagellar hook-basal body complex protein FliE [Nitrospiraceae bacterium]|nr:MAG: flagellar hook-basal body complex protein FliE [Nitrospiraceae bacterium]
MADLPIKDIGSKIGAGEGLQPNPLKNEPGSSFDAVISEALGKVSQVQKDVETAVNELAAGGDITDAVLAIEKADMSFQLMVEIRNKLITTYEEVMKMPV